MDGKVGLTKEIWIRKPNTIEDNLEVQKLQLDPSMDIKVMNIQTLYFNLFRGCILLSYLYSSVHSTLSSVISAKSSLFMFYFIQSINIYEVHAMCQVIFWAVELQPRTKQSKTKSLLLWYLLSSRVRQTINNKIINYTV